MEGGSRSGRNEHLTRFLRFRPSLALLAASCGLFGVDGSTIATADGATIAGGLFHTCMIVQDLTLRCFGGGSSAKVGDLAATGSVMEGFGSFGQIGSGSNETFGDEPNEMGDDLSEVDLGDNTVQQVAAGQSHTCVLLTSKSVACWGFNSYGQLGLGDETSRGLLPSDMGDGLGLVDLGTNKTAVSIGCGQHHSCAVLDDGSLKCWGANSKGMLGLGDTYNRGNDEGDMGDNLLAVDLGTGRTAVMIDGGRYHSCAVLDNAALKCWGGNNSTGHNYGQLGQENNNDIGMEAGQMGDDIPEIDLGTDRTVLELAVGWFHTCVILDNAAVKCFGRNFDGQLGLGDEEDRGDEEGEMGDALPDVDLGHNRYAVAITCGRWHTCVLLDNDDVKCFGANLSDDLGAGQLGLEDTDNRGMTISTSGDGLEVLNLGTGRTAGWVVAAYDHTCVIFADFNTKCWGLNASGQLGLEDTEDRGDLVGSMGDSLPVVLPGLRMACPPSPLSFDGDVEGEDGGGGLDEQWVIALALLVAVGCVCLSGAVCLFCRRRLEKGAAEAASVRCFDSYFASNGEEEGRRNGTMSTSDVGHMSGAMRAGGSASSKCSGRPESSMAKHLVAFPGEADRAGAANIGDASLRSVGSKAGIAAAGTAGVVIAGGMAAGWNVIGLLAENLPWIGVAYHLLNEIADIVDTKQGLQGNMDRIKIWAVSLQEVIVAMGRQMQKRPMQNARALEHMSADVVSNLQILVDAVASYNQKGALAQYAASRSCQKAVDAADTSLRGALAKLAVGQGAELMSMVGRLEDAGLVVDEKLDIIIEHLRKHEEHAARLEIRLAKYSESMAEILGQYSSSSKSNRSGSSQTQPTGKTLTELGKAQLDKLQISKDDVSYPSSLPFATGTFSEVYQVVHGGAIKAAKVTNLSRLGVGRKDLDRVFGRFVKELYILSQMQSDRVVEVYGAIATSMELTIVMELAERGSLRTILGDDEQRQKMTPAIQHGLLLDTAVGMEYICNNGVEHRDLKSANCLVTHDWRAKITDFGLSKTTHAISTGSASNMAAFRGGTLVYMAPELMPGGAGVDGKVPAQLSDMYSYGVVVWDVMCGNGELPWAGVGMNTLPLEVQNGKRLDIPAECGRLFRDLMLTCWREEPHRRPTFEHVVRVLKNSSDANETFLHATHGFLPSPPSHPDAPGTFVTAAAAAAAAPPLSDSQSPSAREASSSHVVALRKEGAGGELSITGPGCDDHRGSERAFPDDVANSSNASIAPLAPVDVESPPASLPSLAASSSAAAAAAAVAAEMPTCGPAPGAGRSGVGSAGVDPPFPGATAFEPGSAVEPEPWSGVMTLRGSSAQGVHASPGISEETGISLPMGGGDEIVQPCGGSTMPPTSSSQLEPSGGPSRKAPSPSPSPLPASVSKTSGRIKIYPPSLPPVAEIDEVKRRADWSTTTPPQGSSLGGQHQPPLSPRTDVSSPAPVPSRTEASGAEGVVAPSLSCSRKRKAVQKFRLKSASLSRMRVGGVGGSRGRAPKGPDGGGGGGGGDGSPSSLPPAEAVARTASAPAIAIPAVDRVASCASTTLGERTTPQSS